MCVPWPRYYQEGLQVFRQVFWPRASFPAHAHARARARARRNTIRCGSGPVFSREWLSTASLRAGRNGEVIEDRDSDEGRSLNLRVALCTITIPV